MKFAQYVASVAKHQGITHLSQHGFSVIMNTIHL